MQIINKDWLPCPLCYKLTELKDTRTGKSKTIRCNNCQLSLFVGSKGYLLLNKKITKVNYIHDYKDLLMLNRNIKELDEALEEVQNDLIYSPQDESLVNQEIVLKGYIENLEKQLKEKSKAIRK